MIHSVPDPANRSKVARSKMRELRPRWITGIVEESKAFAESLSALSASELRAHSQRLEQYVKTDSSCDDRRILVLAAAAVREAFRRTLDVQLFDQQIHAGVIVSRGAVAEMQTGEGKTFAVVLPAFVHALAGQGVHVATPNSYLAARDCQKLNPVFQALGKSVGLLREDSSPDETREAYQADVTYGPGHAFGFDYLRDQLFFDKQDAAKLGDHFYSRLCGEVSETPLQRGLHAAIIDEIDHVLIDDAVSPLVLSDAVSDDAQDADVHQAALACAAVLDERHFCIAPPRVELTAAGFQRVYSNHEMTIHPRLIRPWHEYVIAALRARFVFQRDVNYVVREKSVQIVDESTGRIYPDRSWSDGLHQAIEAKEGLSIRSEHQALAKITRQRFFRYYQSLGGMTGTASGCAAEFAAVYGAPVVAVPLRISSKRKVLPDLLATTRAEKLSAIATEADRISRDGRAVLIGTLSIADSLQVAQELAALGLNYRMLNGVQDEDEAGVIRLAGQRGAVTVATNLAGRGTDIALEDEVAAAGGLHVIVMESHAWSRVDRQLIGRCARCGDPGSSRVFRSAEDRLLVDHGPWIARAILRWDRAGRRSQLNLTPRVQRVQSEQQRLAAASRWQLMQTDRDDEMLFNESGVLPDGCCHY